ncbi:hypothetical protein [Ovoidimarina sediminis]|uniref:hypothetical protein n=1 Tax=Ovoidimarina sediminis TaxID=3079856 RepID=UPI00290C82D2|nr:hypothetical protein [Rhodophyticola sp. MJ-SS7]MDU8943918.1 hypothetical protein [Rhodophyticola sp. MJ-SS7]
MITRADRQNAASGLALLCLAGCSGVAYNTTVAATPAARLAMAMSVVPGETTEQGFMTRWGAPVQKIREGGQTEFVYRDMSELEWYHLPQFGDSTRYVIVTFQYGIATGVRTSDGIACRATFPPRPPNFALDNPTQVQLVGSCPLGGLWPGVGGTGDGGSGGHPTGDAPALAPNGGMVEDDAARYPGGGTTGDLPK